MKDLFWMGSSLEDLREFPEDAKDIIGYALHEVQEGRKPKQGIATPKKEIDLIKQRLKDAKKLHEEEG